MSETALLTFERVFYTYNEEEEKNPGYAVQDLSFSVNRGEFVAVLGSNGSGKSTVAKLSNSIFLPSKGKVYVDGKDTSLPENEFLCRKQVGVVFQNPDNQIVASIVEEDVAFGPENLGLPPEEIRRRVDEALKAVGMYEHRLYETHRLSGGQKQRVAIAGIIAMRPDAIVLDEPTAMLDPKGREDVMKTVRELNRNLGITVIFITHFMEEAVLADRVIVMDKSRLRADDTPTRIFTDDKLLSDCGLETTETAKLCALLRLSGVDMPKNILTPDAFVEAFASDKRLPAFSAAN